MDLSSPDEIQPQPPNEVTLLLAQAEAGDTSAVEQLLPLVYEELRNLAQAVFRGQNADHTLQPTALVHEAFLKMTGKMKGVEGKQHFLMIAGRAMRQILTDHARSKLAKKRGGGAERITLHPEMTPTPDPGADIIELDDSLLRLEQVNARHARVLEMRIFGGLTVEETAKSLGISKRSVDMDWALGRTWLRADMKRHAGNTTRG